jgi:hypothetical protein
LNSSSGIECDVVLKIAIIEVKSPEGNGKGLEAQVLARQKLGKPVIGFTRNMGPSVRDGIIRAGGIAAGGCASDIETFLRVIAP